MTADSVQETCEIRIVHQKKEGLSGLLGPRNYFLQAVAIGPNGQYGAGSSEKLIPGPDFHNNEGDLILHEKAQSKLDNLIKKLYAEGWESTGCGKKWYNARFQRSTNK
jgi:hypothetical protein